MFILDALDQKPDGLPVSLHPFQDTQWEGRGAPISGPAASGLHTKC
jgi:hypothetical protein